MAMHAIVVGAGSFARELVQRLGEVWDVAAVDTSAEALRRIAGERPVVTIEGDGTSRLVLEKAGVDRADAVVAATDDDDVNLEVCRIAADLHVRRIVALAADAQRMPEYRRIGAKAFSPHRLAAHQVELQLEEDRITSKTFAGGRIEAAELKVGPNSPVRGRSAASLDGYSVFVAAVVRGDDILMPHTDDDDDELALGDVVTVIGSASELPRVVRMFTAGSARFPLDYGKRVAVGMASDADVTRVAEAATMTRVTKATSLVIVHPERDGARGASELLEAAALATEGIEILPRPVGGDVQRALTRIVEEESVGVIVVPAPTGLGVLQTLRAQRIVSLARSTATPVLVARAHPTYERILVGARASDHGRAAVTAAIDIADLAKADLVAVAVADPSYVAGADATKEAEAVLAAVRRQAATQGVEVTASVGRLNPVSALVDAAHGSDLVALGVPPTGSLLRERVTAGVIRRSSASILLVPATG